MQSIDMDTGPTALGAGPPNHHTVRHDEMADELMFGLTDTRERRMPIQFRHPAGER